MPVKASVEPSWKVPPVEELEPPSTVDGDVKPAATLENRMELPPKIKDKIAIWSSNPTSGKLS